MSHRLAERGDRMFEIEVKQSAYKHSSPIM